MRHSLQAWIGTSQERGAARGARAARGALALVAALLLADPSTVLAQATGQLGGTVTDDTGAVLPGVTVAAANQDNGQVRTDVTDASGYFGMPLLPPGVYDVEATLSGFSTLRREGVKVTVAETVRLELQLAVGELSETVTVTGEAPLIETSNATLGVVVEGKKIVDLPLNGRNFTQLGTLIPGVVTPPPEFGGAAGDAEAGVNGFGPATSGFAVNGVTNQSNNFLLDGATNNDTFNTGFVLRPPPDAIQEFKILTHSYSAEYGRNAGSVVNVVTKSGSNEWHGSAWEFNRDDAFEARNFFAPEDQEKPTLKQNQFGGTLGGPIVKDRFFVFGYYEGFRNTRGTTRNVRTLTAAERAGDFSGGGPIIDPLTGAPFPGDVIPAGRIDPSAQQVVDTFLPLPNSGANRFILAPDVEDNRDQYGIRLDFRPDEKNGILVRYLRSETDQVTPPLVEPAPITSAGVLQDFMVSHTHTFSSNAFNVFRFGYNKIDAEPVVTSGLANDQFGLNIQNLNELAVGLARINVAGLPGLGDPQQPFVKRQNETLQFTNDFTHLTGRHSWKLGVDVRREEMFIGFINRPNGDISFNGSITGNAIADFLLGTPSQFRQASPGADAINEGHGWLYGAYLQDEFRVSANLTLNLGLRYELARPFVDSGDALNAFYPGQQSQRFPEAPLGLAYPGDPGVPRSTYQTDKNNIAPRLALAWDPFGDGETSVRAAWGLFYDAIPGQGDFFQNAVLAPPFNPLLQRDNPPDSFSFRDPLAGFGSTSSGFPPSVIFIGWSSDEFNTPSYQHFNLTVQRQLTGSLAGEIGYVGSRGKNLPIFLEVNPGVIPPGGTSAMGRRYSGFSLIRPTFTRGQSWYNSLQASLRMRPTRGISFLASYTWGHAIDHDSALNVGGGSELRPILPADIGDEASFARVLDRERGAAFFDVRHRFVLSFGIELPTLDDESGLEKAVLGGWQLNGIIQAQTGPPFSVYDTVSSAQFLPNRPDLICDPNNGPKTVDEWFDTSCFVRRSRPETAERVGDSGRNIVRGPGFNRVDLSLFKNFDLGGSKRLQLRIEVFNVFNRANLRLPAARIGRGDFGQITSTNGDGRIIQLGAKFIF